MLEKILVPDIGDYANVDVIEVVVKVGDVIAKEAEMICLETDKATMEIPAPKAGTVKEVLVKVGDKVSKGSPILMLEVSGEAAVGAAPAAKSAAPAAVTPPPATAPATMPTAAAPTTAARQAPLTKVEGTYAGPQTRRFARELGVDLEHVAGTGRKGRVVTHDVKNYVQDALQGGGAGAGLPTLPEVDFKKFGAIEVRPLNRIQKKSGAFLHACWVNIPHVTQFDEADITELEAFRQGQKDIAAKQNLKLTPVVFLMKAVVACLREFPKFNSSLSANGEELIMKQYYNIGVAVDTPTGLVVPVIKNVDKKGLFELAADLATLSQKARDGKLSGADMQGGCFTISSLGGIGGTAFTPIVNAPEVAILGVSKAQHKPIYLNNEFVPRLMLPLSLSYDHRVIDGADAVRFTTFMVNLLTDIRRLLL